MKRLPDTGQPGVAAAGPLRAAKRRVVDPGAGADGSSWSAVIERLRGSGYHVTAPQFPITSLAADVAQAVQV